MLWLHSASQLNSCTRNGYRRTLTTWQQNHVICNKNKKAQLSLTNPRDAKACQKLLQSDVLTTLSLTILAYLHSFSCCCVRNLRKPTKFIENSNLWSSRSSKVIDPGVNRKPMYDFLLVINRKSYMVRTQINLWYWLRRDLKEDLCRASYRILKGFNECYTSFHRSVEQKRSWCTATSTIWSSG